MSGIETLNPQVGKPGRHKWAEPVRFAHKTERSCERCGLVKVTRHEPGELPWLEFYRDGERVKCERTPICEITTEVSFQ